MNHTLACSNWSIRCAILNSAIEFTANILGDAQKNVPQYKQVIVTSSFTSIRDLEKGLRTGYIYSEKYWS
ncbi:putative ketoreductase protein [Botrytis fragariae]|uniref:Putative ketoreductase protein n=1 Tax=Botrytis fragariae TaxID=1964551 RepID=A0A8H6AL20_9HELO|nr:putative ketoreductase protein [Botrytis fragariae]KAF5869572.1 putative ketoreductase protein [Botrytis fragariae]